jgi:hypothetical protein
MAAPKKKKSYSSSSSSCHTGKPNVNGQPPDLRAKLTAAYNAMEYGGGTKTPNENNTPKYPERQKPKKSK